MRFKVVITHDAEYDGYVVDVPELIGCMSQGKTLDEALQNIKDAIKGWLLVEEMHGRLDRHEEQEVFLGEVTVQVGMLSNLSGKDAVKIFEQYGYSVDHQTGSHMILYHQSRPTLSIPDHKELAPGLLRGLIRKSGISLDEFRKAR